ncbi:MAG: hypothetical protein AB1401_07940 [Thermodesulfobacteriota bacterium]
MLDSNDWDAKAKGAKSGTDRQNGTLWHNMDAVRKPDQKPA